MVTVSTLDQITQNKKNISLLKIDVDGYEKFILEGGINTLKNINLKVIIIELNGSNEYYNYPEKDIINFLNNFHFKPYKGFGLRVCIHSERDADICFIVSRFLDKSFENN